MRLVCSSKLPAGARMMSDGMRYSNMEPDQEMRAAAFPTGVTDRPSRNQWRAGIAFFATGVKARRARLGGEQVIAVGVESAVRRAPDREQPALLIEQEPELHPFGHPPRH